MRHFIARESTNADRQHGVIVLALSGRALRGDAREGVGWVHRIKLGGPGPRMMELLRGFDVEDEGDWTIMGIGLDDEETYVLSMVEEASPSGHRLVLDTDEPTDQEIAHALTQLGAENIEARNTQLHRLLDQASEAIHRRRSALVGPGPGDVSCRAGSGGDITFMAGAGGDGCEGVLHGCPGSVRFGIPDRDGWLLELCPGGQIKVRGKVADTDLEVVEGFKRWLAIAALFAEGGQTLVTEEGT